MVFRGVLDGIYFIQEVSLIVVIFLYKPNHYLLKEEFDFSVKIQTMYLRQIGRV